MPLRFTPRKVRVMSMATQIELNDELLDQAMKLGEHQNPKDAVEAALKEYVELRQPGGWENWVGTVEYFDDYDYKANRKK